jgi:regulator of RNase E activity RraA
LTFRQEEEAVNTPLSREQIDELRSFGTCAISDAIETFGVRLRNEGFATVGFRCLFKDLPPMVGYAATLKIRAARSAEPGAALHPSEHWAKALDVPPPRIVVVEDLDDPAGVGSYWGEVNANLHRALGCIGVVTNGGVRDLEEVAALRFHFFAAHISVSHANVHIVEAGTPVSVGGLTVRPGDLLHGDRHGVLNVPRELAARIPEGAAKVADMERRIIDYCRSSEFTLAGLEEVWRALRG